MAPQWLIVADDLTGAADCAIAFAKRGLHTTVRWRGELDGGSEAVLSYDANSRGLPAPEAAARHAEVLAGLHRPETRLLKKIDSTLRGQPVAELAATLTHVRAVAGDAFGILAPAFPGTGRTTEDGRIRVGGSPLEDTETWARDHSYPTADLAALLAESGIAARRIGLEAVRSGEAALREALAAVAPQADIAVCDAVSDDDLARIAAATCGAGSPVARGLFWIGTGGLAQALAGTSRAPSAPPPDLGHPGGGTLIVVGSLAAASRAAARRLVAESGVRHMPIDPEFDLGSPLANGHRETIRAALEAGEDVLVEVTMGDAPDLAHGPAIADRLGRLLAPAGPHIGGLAATGGETSAALLAHLGIDGLRLVDEIEPGVSLGLTLGALSIPIVTKAGAFGDEGTLIRAARRLRAIHNQGTVA